MLLQPSKSSKCNLWNSLNARIAVALADALIQSMTCTFSNACRGGGGAFHRISTKDKNWIRLGNLLNTVDPTLNQDVFMPIKTSCPKALGNAALKH